MSLLQRKSLFSQIVCSTRWRYCTTRFKQLRNSPVIIRTLRLAGCKNKNTERQTRKLQRSSAKIGNPQLYTMFQTQLIVTTARDPPALGCSLGFLLNWPPSHRSTVLRRYRAARNRAQDLSTSHLVWKQKNTRYGRERQKVYCH